MKDLAKRFAIDVALGVPAIMLSGFIWYAAMDAAVLFAIWKQRGK